MMRVACMFGSFSVGCFIERSLSCKQSVPVPRSVVGLFGPSACIVAQPAEKGLQPWCKPFEALQRASSAGCHVFRCQISDLALSAQSRRPFLGVALTLSRLKLLPSPVTRPISPFW